MGAESSLNVSSGLIAPTGRLTKRTRRFSVAIFLGGACGARSDSGCNFRRPFSATSGHPNRRADSSFVFAPD